MIWGMLRVKNEARWIEKVIQSLWPVCDQIWVFDDHSEDETSLICARNGCAVIHSPFDDLHEARDKDYLLECIWKAGAGVGDHCIMIDGDEVLHKADLPILRESIRQNVLCASFQIIYLWDREDQIRVDRWYRDFRRPSLFRLDSKELSFKRTTFGGNLHCSSAPAQVLDTITPISVRLLHYGYLHREDRIRKYHWYNKIDPDNSFEDRYRHMVIGDLFPAWSSFRWAGPLELRAL
jgi:glycosyltransferase involved in cell wall biosynthesis